MFYAKSTGWFYDKAIHGDNIPDDAVEITSEDHAALLEGQTNGKIIVADAAGRPMLQDPPAPSTEQVVQSLSFSVQAHLDATAKERGYDGILSLCSYATSSVAKFAAEGQAGVNWRDAVWADATLTLEQVLAGAISAPTAEELIAALPPMVWPN